MRFECPVCNECLNEEPQRITRYGAPELVHICPKLCRTYDEAGFTIHESTGLRLFPLDYKPKWRLPIFHWIKPRWTNRSWWFYLNQSRSGIFGMILGLKIIMPRE